MRRRRSRSLPRESRTIPLKADNYRGNGEDFGKYYRCWNCGHICNEDKDSLGNGANSVTHEDFVEPATGANNGDPLTSIATLDGDVMNYQVALELGSDGSPKGIAHTFQTVINGGCPFCGCKNWRGDNP
jgi:hypothetical protein